MNRTVLLLLVVLFARSGVACPLIEDLIDYNCDGKLKIVAVGDSFVLGFGDQAHGNRGGYVLRLRQQLQGAKVQGIGLSGKSSGTVLNAFRRALSGHPAFANTRGKIRDADYVLIDVGRNDYYEDRDPEGTVDNIQALASLLRAKIGKKLKSPPIIIVSTLAPTRRSFQQPFIDEVNDEILDHEEAFPLQERADQLSEEYISGDGLHPNSSGYAQLEFLFEEVLRFAAQDYALERRHDDDLDGVYDYFETKRFKTSPANPDTDGDGFGDGAELFVFRSDPSVPNAACSGAPCP